MMMQPKLGLCLENRNDRLMTCTETWDSSMNTFNDMVKVKEAEQRGKIPIRDGGRGYFELYTSVIKTNQRQRNCSF